MAHRLVVLGLLVMGATLGAPAAYAQTAVPDTTASRSDHRTGFYFVAGGDTIFYQTAGSGPAMLLIHGFPLSGALFEHQLHALSASYPVITPDLPGFGKSKTGARYQTEEHYAQDLFALLDSLGVTTAIIGGHSMGGQVTLEMYREQPSRFNGMILFDTNPAPASIVEQAQWPAYGVQAMTLGSASIAAPVAGVMATGRSLMLHPELGTDLKAIVSEAMPEGVFCGGHALATRYDYRPLLASISVPALVVVGQDDTVYPYPVSQALQKGIAGSTLAIIPGAAHASMFQKPVEADDAVTKWAASSGLAAR